MSSATGNGGVFASFSTSSCRTTTSTSPVASFGLTVSARAPPHAPAHADHELRAQALGLGHQRLVVLVEDHLRDAGAIADVDEQQAAQVADAVHPSEQHDVGADVVGAQRAAGMGAGQIAELLSHVASVPRESPRPPRPGRRCSGSVPARFFTVTVPAAISSLPRMRDERNAAGISVLDLLADLVGVRVDEHAQAGGPQPRGHAHGVRQVRRRRTRPP